MCVWCCVCVWHVPVGIPVGWVDLSLYSGSTISTPVLGLQTHATIPKISMWVRSNSGPAAYKTSTSLTAAPPRHPVSLSFANLCPYKTNLKRSCATASKSENIIDGFFSPALSLTGTIHTVEWERISHWPGFCKPGHSSWPARLWDPPLLSHVPPHLGWNSHPQVCSAGTEPPELASKPQSSYLDIFHQFYNE